MKMKQFLIVSSVITLHALKNELVHVAAFQTPHPRRPTTYLNADISEWRDLMFEPPTALDTSERPDSEESPLREVCIMPFPLNDVLLQGETKELCLYEERFHHLFEKSKNDHAGVVAMGLIAPPGGILQTMPLCEIESFQTMEGDTGFGEFSILATIRVVGRASLIDIHNDEEEKEYMTGWCTELGDDTSSDNGRSNGEDVSKIGNNLADDIQDVFNSIALLEEKLAEADDDDEEDVVLGDAALRRMQLEAELGLDDDDEDDDELEDDEEDEDGDDESLQAIFQKAFQVAKSSDTQGYRIASGDASRSKTRSIQDLTALSWAYLSQDLWNTDEILNYRLRALEGEDLCERLKLVLVMMMEHRSKLKKTLKSRDAEDE